MPAARRLKAGLGVFSLPDYRQGCVGLRTSKLAADIEWLSGFKVYAR
jgi:hypothetical protein